MKNLKINLLSCTALMTVFLQVHPAYASISVDDKLLSYNGETVISRPAYSTRISKNIEIINSEFEGISREDNDMGGVFYVNGSNNITITGSTFTGNHIDAFTYPGGGVITTSTGNGTWLIEDSVFDSNYVIGDRSAEGGVFNVTVDNIFINNVKFYDNYAKVKRPFSGIKDSQEARGGSIWWGTVNDGDTMKIVDSLFTNLKDDTVNASFGGAIFLNAPWYDDALIERTTFSNLKVIGSGGAIHGAGDLYVKDSHFLNNHADISGGAVFAEYYDDEEAYSFENTDFEGNSAGRNAGAIYLTGGIYSFNDVKFSSNSAAGEGGALYAEDSLTTVTNSTFSSNSAGKKGGAVSLKPYEDEDGEVYNDHSIFNFNDSTFSNNTSGDLGGAVYADGINSATFTNTTFNLNSADVDGGALYFTNSPFTLTTADFSNNTAGENGGAVYAEDSTSTLSGFTLSKNSAEADGGALYFKNSPFTLTTADFSGNTAGGNGGALYAEDSSTTITNSTFSSNSAGKKGGAVFANEGTYTFVDTDFKGNSAGEKGGAIYALADTNIFAVGKDVYFDQNTVGGGVAKVATKSSGVVVGENADDIFYGSAGNKMALNLNANDGKKIIFNGAVSGVSDADLYDLASLNINKAGLQYVDENGATQDVGNGGQVVFNGKVRNSNLNIDNGAVYFNGAVSNTKIALADNKEIKVYFNDGNQLDGSLLDATDTENGAIDARNSIILNNGTINMGNMSNNIELKEMVLNDGVINIANVDIDLGSSSMAAILVDKYVGKDGYVNIEKVTLLSEGNGDRMVVPFIRGGTDYKVVYPEMANGVVYDYDVTFDEKTGDFIWTKASVHQELNVPSVAVMSTIATLNDEIYSTIFSDVDFVGKTSKKLPICHFDRTLRNPWVKAFGSKDNLNLGLGNDVDSNFYGVIGGVSSDKVDEGRGWRAVYSLYGAFARGEQKFAGIRNSENAGYFGGVANFYRDNFFWSVTANAGLMRNYMKDEENFDSYMAGVALKSGYDFYFGKLMVEPSVQVSYTYAKADSYRTQNEVKVAFDKAHLYNVAPEAKVAYEFAKGFNGYVKGRYVMSEVEGFNAKANGLGLPEAELKNYAEYGVGLEKNTDRVSAFAQITRRDGGREGWNGMIGLKKNF